MHPGFEIPGQDANPTHFLEQIQTQQLFLDPHHYATAPAYFKLGLNSYTIINGGGEDALRQPSLGMLHCWQNPQDSTNKQTSFWEPLPLPVPAEASNENSEIVDKQQHLEMKHKDLTHCLDTKSRVQFGELEAIYSRLGATTTVATQTCDIASPVTRPRPHGQVAVGTGDHGSEDEAEASASKKKRKTGKKKKSYSHRLINPMAEFFGNLVQQVMDHQENLQRKFTQVIERLEEERREREERWRNQESVRLGREAAARAREKALANSREAMIVAYLEKITGERIDFPPSVMHDDDDDDDGAE